MNYVNIIGVKISNVNMKETLMLLDKRIEEGTGGYVSVSNVHTTVMAKRNNLFKNIINNAYLAVPDGTPLTWYGKVCGVKNIDRVTGPDIMEQIFKLSQEKGYRNYFYGSTQENLDKLQEILIQKYPKLKIAGKYSPPFRNLTEIEDENIVKEIQKTNPDIIWVGLGAPKQEKWMYDHKDKINTLMIGVGAGFNYFTGEIKRAPQFMQSMGLEWFYRFLQEPKRLWKRYLITNSLFIYYVFLESIKYIKGQIIRKMSIGEKKL